MMRACASIQVHKDFWPYPSCAPNQKDGKLFFKLRFTTLKAADFETQKSTTRELSYSRCETGCCESAVWSPSFRNVIIVLLDLLNSMMAEELCLLTFVTVSEKAI